MIDTAVIFENTSFVKATGADAIALIDPITTQDLTMVGAQHLSYTLFLNLKGKIIVSALIWKINEQEFLFEVANEAAGQLLLNHINRYKLRSKCRVELVTKTRAVFNSDAAKEFSPSLWLDPRYQLYATLLDSKITLNNTTRDKTSLELSRIQAGRPDLFDLPADFFPQETNALELAVSMNKGCYLGQETVARLFYRGKAHRSRYQAVLSQTNIELPASINQGGQTREIGLLTSVASLDSSQMVGMVILRTDRLDGELSLADGSILFINQGD